MSNHAPSASARSRGPLAILALFAVVYAVLFVVRPSDDNAELPPNPPTSTSSLLSRDTHPFLWSVESSRADAYRLDYVPGEASTTLARLASRTAHPNASGSLVRRVQAEPHIGAPAFFESDVRTEESADTIMWIAAEASDGSVLEYDASPRGGVDVDWTRIEVSIVVPEDAEFISFGAELPDGGTVWLRRPEFSASRGS